MISKLLQGLVNLLIVGILASSAYGQIKVESCDSNATAAGLATGQTLVGWKGVGERKGTFDHWWQVDLLIYTELARGPLVLFLDGEPAEVRLASKRYSFKARPRASSEVTQALWEFLARNAGASSAEIQSFAASVGASPDLTLWVVVRRAEVQEKEGELEAAVLNYRKAVEMAPVPYSTELLRLIGRLLSRLRRYEEAELTFDRAIASLEKHDPGGLGLSALLSAQAGLQGRLMELNRSRDLNEEACAIRRKLAPGSWFLGNCLNNLGITAAQRNDLATAESYFLESLDLMKAQESSGEHALGNLGNVARLRGDFDRAESYTRQALEIYRERGLLPRIAAQLTNLANIVGDSGDHDQAIKLYGEALTSAEKAGGDPHSVGAVLLNRGKVKWLKGDLEEAERDLLKAKELFGFELPTTSPEATVVNLLGEVALARGEVEAAIQHFETALAVWVANRPDSSNEATTASSLGQAWLAHGDKTRAEIHFRHSIQALEKQQTRAGGGDRGLVAFRNKFIGLYRVYQNFLIDEGREVEAFELYERSRAQALRALLRGRDLVFAVDQKVERERRQIGGRIESTYRRISRLPTATHEDHEKLRLELEELHAERDALSQRLRAASPRIAAAESPPSSKYSKIRSALPPETLLLAYSLGKDRSTLFVVDPKGGLETHTLSASTEELRRKIERWSDLVISPRPRREYSVLNRQLTQLLLGPVAKKIATSSQLVIIPDGSLHQLAFGALLNPNNVQQYLVEKVALVREVSASVYANRSPESSRVGSSRVAVFADPAGSSSAVARFRKELGRLPASRNEAQAVKKVYGDNAVVYLDDRATEKAARIELENSGITHFACHAIVDPKLPLDSALSLSDQSGEGLLQAWEIAEQLEVHSELVVLSACETAGGGARSGEGIIGLVRAFQVAGAESVIATLWIIGDESSAALMERFHHHLSAGKSRASALQEAQIELIRGPVGVLRDGETVMVNAASPKHWAAFILLGSE